MIRVIIDGTIKVSRYTQEYGNSFYRGLLLRDIEITKELVDGFMQTTWGEIEVSIVAFRGNDVTKNKQTVTIDIYHDELLVFSGIGERSIGNNSFIYTLYTDLPLQGEICQKDINDKYIPYAFGTIAHYTPLLKDSATYTYYLPSDLTVTEVYDDGVAGVLYTTDVDGNIALTNTPVGEISFSVTNTAGDVKTVVEKIASLNNLTTAITATDINNFSLNFVIKDGSKYIDILKKIANYTSNTVSIVGTVLNVYSKDYFSQTIKVDNFNNKPLKNSVNITLSKTYKSLTLSYNTTVSDTSNYVLLRESDSVVIDGTNSYASAINLTALDTNTSNADTELITRLQSVGAKYQEFLAKDETFIECVGILNAENGKVIYSTISKYGDFIVNSITHKIGKTLTTILGGLGNANINTL